MIQPTLFVGLGTTGTNILKKLRELMSEEYGRGGLPIFRYIAIETDGAMDVENTNQMKDYERINLVSATIDNFNMIKRKLDRDDKPYYNPHLADWLNPDLLNFALNFTAGAAHIRMAGRLCLWENWDEMQGTLSKALGAIIAPATIAQANAILLEHFKAKKLPFDGILVGGDIHIYVVGSLCGGTCSGMMIDMAYYCRSLLGKKDGNEIHGIFTMHDKGLAADNDALIAVHSANCYGGLWELNYYNHPKTTYDVTLPNSDGKVEYPEQNPFDDTMLVSRSGMNPIYKFVDQQGNFDLDGLNLMVALHLFAETAGDTRGLKNAMAINGQALEGFGTLKQVSEGKISVMMKCMASFGLTAVWYPKYRIASAVAGLVSNRLCKNWLDTCVPQATIVNTANREWDQILKRNIDTLTSPEGLPPIKGQVESHLTQARQQWLNQAISANQLSQNMETFPIGDSFKNKFDQGGEYAELMNMQVPECKKAFRNVIQQVLNNQLAKIDFSGTYGLGDVQAYFEALDKEIEKTIQQCPDRIPSLNLNLLEFDQIRRVENNLWTKLIFLHDQSIHTQRKILIDQYCRLISGSRTSIYEAVRNYFLRPILQEIREELGFGVQPMTDGIPNPPPTIKQRLNQIAANLNGCIDKFTVDYNDAINPPRSECVKIVTNNPANQINTDAQALSHQIAQTNYDIELLNGKTMAEFLVKEQQDITAQMTETYRQLSLAQIQVDDVVTKAQDLLNSGSPDIQNLASRSNPYQMFQGDTYLPLLKKPPKIIFGHDPVGQVLPSLQGQLGFSHHGDSSVDHLLFFYQEEYGFTFDDLDVYRKLKQQFDKTPPPGVYGHLTHRNPNFYDLQLHHKNNRLNRWCKVLSRLVREICNPNQRQGVCRVV